MSHPAAKRTTLEQLLAHVHLRAESRIVALDHQQWRLVRAHRDKSRAGHCTVIDPRDENNSGEPRWGQKVFSSPLNQ